MAGSETIATTVDAFLGPRLDLEDRGHTIVRNPVPPFFLGWRCVETGERVLIRITDFKATGDLDRVKKIEKERKRARKAKEKAARAAAAAEMAERDAADPTAS